MKLKYLKTYLLGAALAMSPTIATAQEAGKADLKQVTQNLDMDGQFFMANNIEGDLGKIANLVNDWAKTQVANGSKKLPESFDAEKMLKEMGLDQVVAYGRSAKHEGDHWVSKMYVQTGGSDKGLLSLLGGKNQPFAVTQFAPSGSDFAMEMNMDLRQVSSMMKLMNDLPKCKRTERMMEGMSKKLPSGITGEELMNKLNMKVSVVAKLDDEKREVCPKFEEYTFPKIHSCVRLEGANLIWDQIKPMAGFMMKMEEQADGTMLMTPHKMPKKGWMKDKKPVILVDTAKNQIWMASSSEFLAECRGNGAKLAADEQFKAITGGAANGNMLAYISNQTCMEIRQVKEAKYKKAEKKKVSDGMLKQILDHMTESKNGYVMMVQKGDTGTNVTLKAPCPVKEMMCGGKRGCGKKYGKRGCGKCSKGGCEKGGCSKCEKGKCGCDKGGECKCEKGKCKCAKKDKPESKSNPDKMKK